MSEPQVDVAALRRELRSRLGQLGVALQILAEAVLGEADAPIDWVAIEPSGRVWVVLVDPKGGDEALLTRALAQRAWVQARLEDWAQLVPGLAARRDVRPRLLLLAPELSRALRVAAREADADGLRLARYRWQPVRGGLEVTLEPIELPGVPVRGAPGACAPARIASVFRSGLSDRDFEA